MGETPAGGAGPADVSETCFWKTSQRAMLFTADTGAPPGAGCCIPGTFTDKIQVAFKLLCSPGLTTSPSQRCHARTYTIALCNTDFVLCGHCRPVQQQGSPLHRSNAVDVGPGASVHAWYHLKAESQELLPDLS